MQMTAKDIVLPKMELNAFVCNEYLQLYWQLRFVLAFKSQLILDFASSSVLVDVFLPVEYSWATWKWLSLNLIGVPKAKKFFFHVDMKIFV